MTAPVSNATPSEVALRLVWRLRREHPDVQMRLVVGAGTEPAANPKVRNLLHMLRVAQHDHILISDSNVMAPPDYLRTTVQEMADPQVGLVSNPIVGVGEQSVGAALENFHLNTLVVGSVCLSDMAGQPCVIGKSMLMRRTQLDGLGGLRAMRDILAEDFVLGRLYHQAGYRVVLSDRAVHTRNIRMPVQRFLSRHLRWAQLRRHVSAPLFFSEVLAYLTPWLVLLALCSLETPLRSWVLRGTLAALLVRLASDVLLARHVAGEWPAVRAVLLAPLKDCAMLALWSVALLKRSVSWRGNPMRIGAGSRVSMVGQDAVLHGVRSREA